MTLFTNGHGISELSLSPKILHAIVVNVFWWRVCWLLVLLFHELFPLKIGQGKMESGEGLRGWWIFWTWLTMLVSKTTFSLEESHPRQYGRMRSEKLIWGRLIKFGLAAGLNLKHGIDGIQGSFRCSNHVHCQWHSRTFLNYHNKSSLFSIFFPNLATRVLFFWLAIDPNPKHPTFFGVQIPLQPNGVNMYLFVILKRVLKLVNQQDSLCYKYNNIYPLLPSWLYFFKNREK